MSHAVENEIISLMGHQLLRELLANIRNSGFYSIMADETKDISNTEQLVICIRWVYSSYCIHEDPIGLVSTSATDAESIANAIKDVFVRCALPLAEWQCTLFFLAQCRGQAYDGAASMKFPPYRQTCRRRLPLSALKRTTPSNSTCKYVKKCGF